MARNVIIGQSGGPTAVINSSLAGVYKAACSLGADKVYGMKYGIEHHPYGPAAQHAGR